MYYPEEIIEEDMETQPENLDEFSRVLVMNQSRVYAYGTVDEVFARADEIESIGLSTPQITKVFRALAAKGYPVNPNIYRVEDGREELLRLRKGHGEKAGDGAC